MLQFFSAAHPNHENYIYQAFHLPAVPIKLNPYQGLKRRLVGRIALVAVPIKLNPYQGLKLFDLLDERMEVMFQLN